MKFPRNARVFRGRLDAVPFAGVLFCMLIFVLLSLFVYTPGVVINLPVSVSPLAGVEGPTLAVAMDSSGRLYFQNQLIQATNLQQRLQTEVARQSEPVTLIVQADKSVTLEQWDQLHDIAASAGIKNIVQAAMPPLFDPRAHAPVK